MTPVRSNHRAGLLAAGPWIWGSVLLLALGSGLLAAWLLQRWDEHRATQELGVLAQRESDALLARTLGGRAMGAIVLAGQLDAQIQATAREPAALFGARREAQRDALETLARSIEADGAFIVNGDGRLVARWDLSESAQNELGVQGQPFVQLARERVEAVHAAVAGSGAERSLFLSAPIYTEPGNHADVSGALVIRLLMGPLERPLTVVADQHLLVSPQGLVFGARRADWLYALLAGADPAEVNALRQGVSFGPALAQAGSLQTLPFGADVGRLRLDGKTLLAARAVLPWHDGYGDWQLLLMREAPWSGARLGAAAALTGVTLGLLLLALASTVRHERARRTAIERLAESAERQAAAAEWQARLNALGARLQLTREVEPLAQAFFDGLSGLLPVHQGALYASPGEGQALRRIAAFGGAKAPGQLAWGEGLVGECALSRQALWLDAPPVGFWTVQTALAEAQPRALLVLPVLRSDKLVGVLELAGLSPNLLDERATLEALLPVLALNLEAALTLQGEHP
jgi:C4-dicarboxylate-specific signal transduction histidine kinase